jgi:hypothetical protein
VLNRLARYRPVLRLIRQHRPASIVEIGSGALGLGEFRSGPFTGVDIAFDGKPVPHMVAVRGSAFELPFPDAAFDMALCIDALEHIDPARRGDAVREALRVTRRVLVLGFPLGRPAREADGRLHRWCRDAGIRPPPWLEEHMQADFPEEALVASLLESQEDLKFTGFGNENLEAHFLLMTLEMHPRRLVRGIASLLRYVLTPLARALLALTNAPPYYRKMFVVEKGPSPRFDSPRTSPRT